MQIDENALRRLLDRLTEIQQSINQIKGDVSDLLSSAPNEYSLTELGINDDNYHMFPPEVQKRFMAIDPN